MIKWCCRRQFVLDIKLLSQTLDPKRVAELEWCSSASLHVELKYGLE